MIKTIEQLNKEFLVENKESDMSVLVEAGRIKEQEVTAKTVEKAKPKVKAVATRRTTPKEAPVLKELLYLVFKIAFIMLAILLLFTFLFALVRYGEPSMAPAVKDGDLVIVHRYKKAGYISQDAIMLEYSGQKQVRRVVAIAGDVVDITESGLYINGSHQFEPDIHQKTERYDNDVEFPMTIPTGHVFVLADSRSGATDSRVYGSVEIEETIGKVMAIIRRRSI